MSIRFFLFLQAEQIKKVTKAQSIIVSDTIWLDSEQPAMTKSLRGLVAFLLKLKLSDLNSNM